MRGFIRYRELEKSHVRDAVFHELDYLLNRKQLKNNEIKIKQNMKKAMEIISIFLIFITFLLSVMVF